MTHYMNEVMALYRGVFRTENRWTMLVDGTSRAGIEAILLSAIRPGDKVLVPVFGRFGHLLCGSRVAVGQKCTPSRCRGARSLRRIRLRMRSSACGRACCSPCRAIPPPPCRSRWRSWERFAVVTMCCSIPTPPRRSAVTRWKPTPGSWTPCPPGCKVPGGPSGTSPITLSPRMEEVIRRRRCEQGIRTDAHHDGVDEMIYSNYFDLGMVMDYWGPERLNHHTEAIGAVRRPGVRAPDPPGRTRQASPATNCTAMRC